MTSVRGASAALLALLLPACGSRSQVNNPPVDIADAADDAANAVATYDRYTPTRPLPAGIPATATATYRCVDGTRFVANFDNRADLVRLRGARLRATWAGQHPASGIWYAGNGGELRGKGKDATLTLNDRDPLACTAG